MWELHGIIKSVEVGKTRGKDALGHAVGHGAHAVVAISMEGERTKASVGKVKGL